MRLANRLALLLLFFCAVTAAARAEEGRLLRFPDVYKDTVVFVSAGDLWISSTQGGPARRLTSDPGLEYFPKFSPDGKWIAFTAEYDGNRDVYVIPATGGEPKRLTYSPDMTPPAAERLGYDNMVLGWTPDSKRVLYRSRRTSFSAWVGQLMTVSLDGGLPEQLPVPRGGYTTFSPDGTKIAYNRVFREFRTWKRYRGGQADEVWTYDLKNGALEKLTDNPAQDNFPMWSGDKIYFLSDRDQFANLFVYDLKSKQTKKLTDFKEYDVKYPSLGVGSIAFENGGYIYLFDLATQKERKLTIELNDDRRLTRAEFINPKDSVNNYDISPDAKRVVFEARGELFTVPLEKGNTRNLTNTSGAHEKFPAWSPDGRFIAYVSDVSGEDELYMIAQDGGAPAVRLTTDGKMARFAPLWSPDSKKLAFADKGHTIWWLDVETKKLTKVEQTPHGEITNYAWSPDSQWIAYGRPEENGFSTVQLYSLAQAKIFPVTDSLTDSDNPAFDGNGKYLYFTSNRDLNASVGNFEYNYSYQKTTRLFVVTLQADAPSPFAPESDEAATGPAGGGEKKPEAKPEFRVDTDGLAARVVGLTMPPGNYGGLLAGKNKVFYVSFGNFQLTGNSGERPSLRMYEIDKKRESEIAPTNGYTLAASGEKMAIRLGTTYLVIDAKPLRPGEGTTLSLDKMQMKLDHRAEWRQMFNEAWRLERDYFYSANMHGVDWPAIKRRYEVLLPHIGHRSDLTYIIGEMIAELHVGHAYTGGGEAPSPKRVGFGLLGADFEVAGGGIRIKTILEGENWREDRRSPLTEPGVNVKVGEFIVAIDGEPLTATTNPYALLENKAGQTITLTVNSQPSAAGARQVKVRPVASETQLRYFNYVERNRRYVEQKSGGRIGYIHIPNMGGDGLNEFVKYYYPQIRKEGLILDDRYNGGGNVSRLIIERLRRTLGAMGAQRDTTPNTYPDAVFTGPMVCLFNELSASDGDIFPAMFKQYKLGKTIGKRSWGGVIGIRGNTPLLDGGYVTRPEFGFYGVNGEWIIENHGVDPDIEVDNPPFDEFNGKDAQLDRAIEEVTTEMKTKPSALPKRPADPIR